MRITTLILLAIALPSCHSVGRLDDDTDSSTSTGDADTDTDTDSDSDSDADSSSGGDGDSDSDGDSDTDGDSDSDADTDGDTDTDSDSDTNPDTGSDTIVDTGSDTNPDTASDTGGDADSDSDTDSDTDGDTDGDTDSDTDGDTDSDTDTDTDADTDTDSDTDTDTDADTDTGPVTCADFPCDVNADCDDSSGAVECACISGWTGDGYVCTDLNECLNDADNNCHQYADCTNIVNGGGFTCECKDGFEDHSFNYDGTLCGDIHECMMGLHNCGTQAKCVDTTGSFHCECNTGYQVVDPAAPTYNCVDINECTAGTHDCEVNESCLNLPGLWFCDCAWEECVDTCCGPTDVCDKDTRDCCTPATCESLGKYTHSWPDGCGYEVECSPWVPITGGSFVMGTDNATVSPGVTWYGGSPAHTVTVPDFEAWKTEVTVNQYRECINAGACSAPSLNTNCDSTNSSWWMSGDNGNRPVDCVNWSQAKQFCEWAGGRLLTEAEWEYLASNGSDENTYPWGNTSPTCVKAAIVNCGYGLSETVCNHSPFGDNDDGLCDLIGNIYEWVEDDYHPWVTGGKGYDPDADGNVDSPLDGSAWIEQPRLPKRVSRGGGTTTDIEYLASQYSRNGVVETSAMSIRGLRCARDAQ